MKRILVTGARAPAALDLIGKLSDSGMDVYAADSVYHPLSRASNKVIQYFAISTPAKNVCSFIDDLEKIIKKHKIDMLIPTCEEVFFISKYKERLEKHCVVFCDTFEKLSTLHNKYDFLEAATDCEAYLPKTERFYNQSELAILKDTSQKVFKPVFSRFASHTIIRPEEIGAQKINASTNFPWVAQEHIDGTEYCTYGIAVNGKLQVHVCYQPTYRAGLGSGIYFTPAFNNNIQKFVSNFVSKHNYTGQIGFDFILTKNNQLYVLECNPRATSGIHCLATEIAWREVFLGSVKETFSASKGNKMVALAMATFGLKYLFNRHAVSFITSFIKAKDPVWNWRDIILITLNNLT